MVCTWIFLFQIFWNLSSCVLMCVHVIFVGKLFLKNYLHIFYKVMQLKGDPTNPLNWYVMTRHAQLLMPICYKRSRAIVYTFMEGSLLPFHLIFLKTENSNLVPYVMCLIQPIDSPSHVCNMSITRFIRSTNMCWLMLGRYSRSKYWNGLILTRFLKWSLFLPSLHCH